MLTLADIMEALLEKRIMTPEIVITEAVIDSRYAIPGCLFVALPGEQADGHDYVGQAFERGASLAFVQREMGDDFVVVDLRGGFEEGELEEIVLPFCLMVEDTLAAMQKAAAFWRRQLDVKVIGITGSVGKSTTKEMVAEVLDRKFKTWKNAGNYNNEIGLPMTILGLSKGHERAVLEMGFYVLGEIQLLCDIAMPEIGVVTNIGLVHAERAGSQEVIAQGKAELVQNLPAHGFALLNYDDPLVRGMADQTEAQVLFYGLTDEADLWADEVEGLGLEGIRFRLHYEGETTSLATPMLGRHSVQTALAAAAVGIVEGLDWQDIVEGLQFGHMPLRLSAVRTAGGVLLLDDTYNASPQSTLAALNLLEDLEGNKVAVLGDMLELGPYEREGHERVGVRAAEVANRLITIGERGKMIAESALQQGMGAEQVTELEDAQRAIELLREILKADDVVLVKGSREVHMDNIVPNLENVV